MKLRFQTFLVIIVNPLIFFQCLQANWSNIMKKHTSHALQIASIQ